MIDDDLITVLKFSGIYFLPARLVRLEGEKWPRTLCSDFLS